MNVPGKLILCGWAILLALAPQAGLGADTNATPDFQEVYGLVRAHLAGANEADLNRAAVQGFLEKLARQVSVTSQSAESEKDAKMPLLSVKRIFDNSYLYLRVAQVSPPLAGQIASTLDSIKSTNKLKGLVLDLRFADGNDYGAAASVADLFVTTEQPLLSWGENSARSTSKNKTASLLVAVLVNHQTAGAAEALAGILRQTEVALMIGAPTAGQALVYTDYPLKDNQRLRIATGRVRLANDKLLGIEGLKPDILVPVSPDDEIAYFADPFKVVAKSKLDFALAPDEGGTGAGASTTNRPSRHRMNEADLVRLQKEGQNPNEETSVASPKTAEPLAPSMQDPALARALDLLKGLAVVQKIR